MPKRGLLAMAYGTPRDLDDVERYYTHIRHGRPPPPELLGELVARYAAIGGRSPLLEITRAQVAGLQQRFDAVSCYLGMKHSDPFIEDAVQRMAEDGIEQALGLVLAPHYSAMSVGEYEGRAEKAAADAGWTGWAGIVESWHLAPGYVDLLERRVHDAVARLEEPLRDSTVVIFTAHSLPAAIVGRGDPYPQQLRETAQAVADLAGLTRWEVAWQSAGRTDDDWLRPGVLEAVERAAATGARGAVVCPCGFVSDHLEVLYDLDVECAARAAELGIAFVRTESPNDDPAFLDTLASVVADRFSSL